MYTPCRGACGPIVFRCVLLALVLSFSVFNTGAAMGQLPPPLSAIPVSMIEDPQIMEDFVIDRDAAIRLGKALFWDMQVGSDGIQSCATCHFHAGADNRIKNQLSPGLLGGDVIFGNLDFPQFGPNYTLKDSDFPFHERTGPGKDAPVLRDVNDTVSSQGVFFTQFNDVILGSAVDDVTPIPDPVFHTGGVTVRRVEPRNSPTVINAVYNIENFWDGRAKNIFNGVNPFGDLDLDAKILVDSLDVLTEMKVRIKNASLASQAVGPPLSDFEMSAAGRTFQKIGKKMLTLKPLALQEVAPNDSVLGALADTSGKGLNTTYPEMIRAAFQPRFWSNETHVITYPGGVRTISDGQPAPGSTDEYTQMEDNFSLLFGLAVQLYESTLVSDDTPFDRFLAGDPNALNGKEQAGWLLFQAKGKCINCHAGSALTGASIQSLSGLEPSAEEEPERIIELMLMAQGMAFYDSGFYNVSVQPTEEGIGRGGLSPFLNPLTGENYPLSFTRLAILKFNNLLPPELAVVSPDLPPGGTTPPFRAAVDGASKTPGLRNVELTGPYFSNGSVATLAQILEFYDRGGNFPNHNIENLDPDITELGFTEDEEKDLLDFLLALTDERVRDESAPFDHPELIIPNGLDANGAEEFITLPAIGSGGRSDDDIPPIQPFPNPPDQGNDPLVPVDPGAGGGGVTPASADVSGSSGGCFIGTLF